MTGSSRRPSVFTALALALSVAAVAVAAGCTSNPVGNPVPVTVFPGTAEPSGAATSTSNERSSSAILLPSTVVSSATAAPSAGLTSTGLASTPESLAATSHAATPRLTPTPDSSVALPEVGLAGVNRADCRSGFRPLVLLHGSFSSVASNFAAMTPALIAAHRCVYGIDYGNGGVAAVKTSAAQVADFVRHVLVEAGRAQVDVIAYSQGGLVLRTALRLDGLAEQVATAAMLAPSWNGTTAPLAASIPASLCPACADQVAGSPLLRQLDLGSDLAGTVRYATISTEDDAVVTPIGSQVPTGPPARVRSLVMQDRCPDLVVDHQQLPANRGVIAWTVAALQTDGRPPATALPC